MKWFKKAGREDPDRKAFREEFEDAIRTLQDAEWAERAEVGDSINMAHSVLQKELGGVSGFQQLHTSKQREFLAKLQSLEEKMTEETPLSGLGVGLFKMWLTVVMTEDAELEAAFRPSLAELSSDGDMSGM